jgi:hypothetical protein
MRLGLPLALTVAACATDPLDSVPARADVELVVAAPAGVRCIDVRFEDSAGHATSYQAAIGGGGTATVRFSGIPVGAYSVTAQAYAADDCALVPSSPSLVPWATIAPVLLVLNPDGPAALTLELFRTRPLSMTTMTTLAFPWRGTFLANAMGDFLGDGSTVVIFGGPSFQNEKTPFKAIRIAQDGALSDVTATLIVDSAPAATHARRALAVDLNGDGRLDFYSANHGWDHDPFPGETQTLLLSRPDGELEDVSAALPPINLFEHTTTAGDLRGNGRIDILVGQLGMQNNPGLPDIYRGPNTAGDFIGPFMLRNDGAGAFAYDNTSLPAKIAFPQLGGDAPGFFTSSLFVDVNQDGRLDLVLGGEQLSTHGGSFYLNDGSGTFEAAAEHVLPVGTFGPMNTITVDVLSVDIDRDGRPDLLLSQTPNAPQFYGGRKIQLLMNDGATFVDETETRIPGQSGAGGWAQFIFYVDFDGDGSPDIFLQADHPQPGDALVYLNDGTGHFAPAPAEMLPPPAEWHSLTPVDFDHDGRTDLVGFEPQGGTLTVRAYRR